MEDLLAEDVLALFRRTILWSLHLVRSCAGRLEGVGMQ